MWLWFARPRFSRPVAVLVKRFMAARFVFIFGIRRSS
jgi:hypothetical protein